MYKFGKFRFDPANHLLLNEERPVSLTPKAFDFLLVLVENGTKLTTKEELMQKVWPDSFVEEANLTVNVSALRKLLGETTEGQSYIETVPKKGYRFIAPITEVLAEAQSHANPIREPEEALSAPVPDANEASCSGPTGAQSFPKKRSWPRWAIWAFGLALVVAAGLRYLAHDARVIPSHPSGRPHRLAVLPFRNLRADSESEFLGFSLADAVITKLGYVSEVTVLPSYAVQKYKTQTIDILRIASELKVDTVLIGTFLREGSDLRITCQLIDTRPDSILWKGEFDVKYDKLLTVHESVANQIIKGLEVTLSPSESAQLKPDEAAISPLAYEYYFRGIDLYSASDFPMAIKMLEKSAELAPGYGLTWANLGKSYTASASFQFGGAEHYRKAQKAFERAIAIKSDQIDARVYMANMFTDTGRVEKAVPLLREALKTNPNHAEVHWELGYAYRFAGMLRESVLESENARRLDPGVKLNSSTLNGYLYLGQYSRFLESLPETDESALIAFYRGLAYYYQGKWGHAAEHFDQALGLDHSLFQTQIGKALCLGIRHRQRDAIAALRALETKINQKGVGDPEAKYKIAQAYAVLGDKPSALRVLRQSIDSGFFSYPYFVTDPLLNTLRHEPEFDRLMSAARQRHTAFATAFFT